MSSHDSVAMALLDQLAEEFADRYRRGERPAIKEYTDRHPELADEIREVFAALVGIEQVQGDCRDAATPATPPLQRVGDFRILREIGRGGMGVVYEAEQGSLGRRVALKVLPTTALGDGQALERFRREARAAARLHHTNIVPVFEIGQDGNTCFYAMQFIQGQGLDLVIEELRRLRTASPALERKATAAGPDQRTRPFPAVSEAAISLLTGRFELGTPALAEAKDHGLGLPAASPASVSAVLPGQGQISGADTDRRHYFDSVARIGVQAPSALAYAHQRGVLHRDIKTSNLLLDGSGVVWVTDFGLAKTDEDGLTRTGDILGTFRYMAPERFQGESDGRSDVYALGLTLYELLTLRPGFDAPDRLRVMEQVKETDPPSPRSLDSRIPRDLETIVLTAIAKDPRRRYQSAQAMADDLGRFLAGEPIKARRTSQWHRTWLWCRRHPAVASLLAVILCLSCALTIGTVVKNAQLSQTLAKEQLATEAANVRLWESLRDRARALRMSGQPGQRVESLQSIQEAMTLPLPPGHSLDELRNEAIAALALPDIEKERNWEALPAGSMAIAFDASYERYVRVATDGSLSLRRTEDDTELLNWKEEKFDPFSHSEGVLALSPDGRHVAVLHPQLSQLRIRRLEEKSAVLIHRVEGVQVNYQTTDGFTPDGKQFLYGLNEGPMVCFDLASGQAQRLPAVPGKFCLRINPSGANFALITNANGKNAIEIRDLATGALKKKLPQEVPADVIAWHPDGRRLATTGGDLLVRLWDTGSGQLLRVFEGNKNPGVRLAFSLSGRLLISNNWSGTLRIWEVSSGKQVFSIAAPGYWLLHMSDKGRIPTLDPLDPHRIQIWRLHEGAEFRTVTRLAGAGSHGFSHGGHPGFAENNHLLLVGQADIGGIIMVDPDAGQEVGAIPFSGQYPLLLRPEKRDLLTYGRGGLMRWPITEQPVANGQFRLGPPERLSQFVRFDQWGSDPTGRVFVMPNYSQGAILLRPDQPDRLVRLRPQSDVRSCAVSPDGRWVATGSHGTDKEDGAKVWDADSGQLIKTLPVPRFSGVQFSPDGRWLRTTSNGRLWHTGTWDEGPVVGGGIACFSPDSQTLAVEGELGAIRLTTTQSGQEIARLASPERTRILPLVFSPDGGRLVTAGADTQALHIWDLRAIRSKLRNMGLDWSAAPLSDPPNDTLYRPLPPAAVQVDVGRFRALMEADELVQRSNNLPPAQAIGLLRQALQKDPDNAEGNNNLAWFLLTGPRELRNPKEALPFARKAVEASPRSSLCHNTLGVALYRNDQPSEAIPILELSLQTGGGAADAHDLFFLAMCHHKLGQAVKAKECYQRGVDWFQKNQGQMPAEWTQELSEFQAEAKSLLFGSSSDVKK